MAKVNSGDAYWTKKFRLVFNNNSVKIEDFENSNVVVGDGINHVFGDGATDKLQSAADSVGAAVEDLASNIHGAIAGALTFGRNVHDRIWGEGATDEALGNARIAAQQGVEVVEDGFEWIQGLASSLAPSART